MTSLLEERLGSLPGAPPPADLADVWLEQSLVQLLDAFEVPLPARRELLESGVLPTELAVPVRWGSHDPTAGLRRLDACRDAVVFAALAVETRLNRLLKDAVPSLWHAVSSLPPAEKFRLAPRLLADLESSAEHRMLSDHVVELYELRDELVEADARFEATQGETAWRFNPGSARRTVEVSAQACCFLADLAGREDESRTGRLVSDAARAFTRRREPAAAEQDGAAELDWGETEFPPDLIGS